MADLPQRKPVVTPTGVTRLFDGFGNPSNWSDPANWANQTPPAPGDAVSLEANPTITFSVSVYSVAFEGGETLTIGDGAALTVANGMDLGSFGALDMSGLTHDTYLNFSGTLVANGWNPSFGLSLSGAYNHIVGGGAAISTLETDGGLYGSGTIVSLTLQNGSNGVISGALAFDTQSIANVNSGLIRATAALALSISDSAFDQSGGGAITATGAGATVTLTSSTINNGQKGAVTADSSGIVRLNGATINGGNVTLASRGAIESVGGANTIAAAAVSGGTVGAIVGKLTLSGSTITDAIISASGGGSIDVASDSSIAGATSVQVGGGGSVTLETAFNGNAQFSGTSSELTLAQNQPTYSGVISGFSATDILGLASLQWVPGDKVQLVANNVLDIKNASNAVIYAIQLSPTDDFGGTTFALAPEAGHVDIVPSRIVNDSASNAGVYIDISQGVAYTTTPGGSFAAGLPATPIASQTSVAGATGAIGSTYDDRLIGDSLANVLNGGGGNDIIYGGGGADTITDGDGAATVIGSGSITLGNGANFVELLNGFASTVTLGNGADIVYGGDTGATVNFGTGGNHFFAGGGADTIRIAAGGAGQSIYGDGSTILDYSAETSAIVALLGSNYVAHDGTADYAAGIASITGTNFGDHIEGGAGTRTIVDGSGDDVIYGGAATSINAGAGANTIIAEATAGAVAITAGDGANLVIGDGVNDTITLGNGVDTVYAGAGESAIAFGAGVDRLYASTGVDDVSFAANGAGHDVYGNGKTTVDYSAEGAGIAAYLASDYVGHDGTGDYVAGVVKIVGTNHGDRIEGGAGVQTIVDGSGDDTIYGGAATLIDAGGGNNTVIAQASSGAVAIRAGDGVNVVVGDSANDTITLGNGADTVDAGSGTNSITFGTGADRFYASTGVDHVYFSTGSGAHYVYGDGKTIADYSREFAGVTAYLDSDYVGHDGNGDYVAGIAQIVGSSVGANMIQAGSTDLKIVGGARADAIYDGAGGHDVMTGGGGGDQYYFASDAKAAGGVLDEITDFASGATTLQLQGTGFDALTAGATPTLFNLSSAADPGYATFAATADAFAFNASTHTLLFNDSGRASVVSLVQLDGVASLAAGDLKIY